jgi:hypothetical protein
MDGYNRPTPPPYRPAGLAPLCPTDFDPFAALGLPITATAADIVPAYRRAMRHRHESVLARFPATATLFPSQVEVQQAHDYLLRASATATKVWNGRHRHVFHPELPVGDAGVFTPHAATAPAIILPDDSTPARRRSAATASASGSSYRPATAHSASTASSGTATGTPDDPINLASDDDDDDDEDGSPTPSFRPRPRRRTATAVGPRGPATASGHVGRTSSGLVNATPTARSRPAPRATHRSGGNNSSRNTAIANPITNERIVVGEWALAAGATANAVVAGFDVRGRLFYRIISEDVTGAAVAAPTATATRFEDIRFRAAYQNMTADQVRTAIDQHLRLHAFARP